MYTFRTLQKNLDRSIRVLRLTKSAAKEVNVRSIIQILMGGQSLTQSNAMGKTQKLKRVP